jgi:non-ribosomal peptide synthase protein (TIGR01720 family)
LLQEVPKAYHTQINDVLLAALVTAFRDWTDAPKLLVDLEGHGREPIADDIDLSRTVGWFTAIYPVLLDVEGLRGPGEILPAIKEQLRRIPDHGISYGALRYLSEDREFTSRLRQLHQSEVSFNYLGQLDGGSPADTIFRPARESSGSGFSERGKRRYLLDLLGSVEAGQLRIAWVYSERIHDRATIEWVAQRYIAALREIIAHCLAPNAGGYTPSDFPLARLDAGTLSKLSQFIDEEQ